MNERLDWDQLQSFLAVVRAGRLTVAARQLAVTHSTLSRRMTRLEEALGTALFHRQPSGYVLTDRGRLLQDHAQKIESAVFSALAEITGSRLRVAGAVRIGAPEGFGAFFLAPLLAGLAAAHPGLEIQLVTLPRVFSLSKREADIAIGLTAPEEGRLHARRLTDYALGLYGSREYLSRCGPIAADDDLERHQFIGYIGDLIYSPELDYLPLVAPGIQPAFTSSSLIAQFNAARAGQGLCVLPCFLADPEPGLVRLLAAEVALTRSLWLIMHADMRDLARIRVPAEFIALEVRRQRHCFAGNTQAPRRPDPA